MSGSWTPALSKVELIVTGAAMQLYIDGFVTMVSS